ncbi:MAG TPA: hypothetical protein VKH46_04690 [Thermoanaerobaculia bacterium]|jgi:hypothetical protein|nr:hypothetical protein [Thermoanaerobaculia bacterium]
MRKKLIFIVPAAIVGMAVFIAVGGALVMLLWNWLLPTLFGWRLLTFWQAVGVLALCRILFGRSGLGRGYRRVGSWRRERGGWVRMTAEEREEFRRRFRDRWAGGPPPNSEPTP